MPDYGKNIVDAVDVLINTRLQALKFDRTVTCVITNADQADKGIYTVSDGSVGFIAYSDNFKLKENDQVQVLIPEGDYTARKVIVNKVTKENKDKPITYTSPFNYFIKGTNNLVGQNKKIFINVTDDSVAVTKVMSNSDGSYTKFQVPASSKTFTKLGIRADFLTDLSEHNKTGNYALVIKGCNSKNEIIARASLNCSLMQGDYYNYFTYSKQEAVFTLPNYEEDDEIKYFYVTLVQNGKFTLQDEEESSWIKGLADSQGDKDYISVKNIEVYFGYELNENMKDECAIFTPKGTVDYTNSKNKVSIKASWLRSLKINKKTEWNQTNTLKGHWNNTFKGYVNKLEERTAGVYGIKWFRRSPGAAEVDKAAGPGWVLYSDNNTAEFANDPNNLGYKILTTIKPELDTDISEEVFKIIIYKNLKIHENSEGRPTFDYIPIESKELHLRNKEYEDNVSQDKSTQLIISPTDSFKGNYFLYNYNGSIIKRSYSSETREMELKYDGENLHLNQGDTLTWKIPKNYTMIVPVNKDSYTVEGGYYTKTLNYKQNDKLNFQYKISGSYTPTCTNNTIICELKRKNKGKKPYVSRFNCNFGWASSSGSDVVFTVTAKRIDYNEANNKIEVKDVTNSEFVIYPQNNTKPVQLYKIEMSLWSNETQSFINLVDESTGLDLRDNITMHLSQPVATKNNFYYCKNSSGAVWEPPIQTGSPPHKMNQILKTQDNGKSLYFIMKVGQIANNTGPYTTITFKLDYEDIQNLIAIVPVKYAGQTGIAGASGPVNIIYASDSNLIKNSYNSPYRLVGNVTKNSNEELVWELSKYMGANNWNRLDTLEKDTDTTNDGFSTGLFKSKKSQAYTLKPSICYEGANKLYIIRANLITRNSNQEITSRKLVWAEPIIMQVNSWGNSVLNEWDNKLTIDENNNRIMSAMMVAGEKNSQNQFTGVIMGKIQGDSDIDTGASGVYGYREGQQAYAFKDDGTAFIGGAGGGRILFDGTNSCISNQGYEFGDGTNLDLNDNKLEMLLTEPSEDNEGGAIYQVLLKNETSGNNKRKVNTVFSIGQKGQPNLQIDKSGNIVTTGNLTVLDSDGNTLISFGDDDVQCSSFDNKIVDITGRLDTISTKQNNLQSTQEATSAQINSAVQNIEKLMEKNYADKVITNIVDIDNDGIKVGGSVNNADGETTVQLAKTYTNMNYEGFFVKTTSGNIPVLTADYQGVVANNLTACNYIILGNARFVQNKSNKKMQCFWVED